MEVSRTKRENEGQDPIPKKRRRVDEEEVATEVTTEDMMMVEEVPSSSSSSSSSPSPSSSPSSVPPYVGMIGKKAPSFSADAVVNGEIKKVNLNDYLGKWVILLFYPLDWTFVCPTELLSFSSHSSTFSSLNAEVLGISTDSVFSHLAFSTTPRSQGGLGGNQQQQQQIIPLLSDISQTICKTYGTLDQSSSHSLRATFLLSPSHIVKHITINDPPVGRQVQESIRLIKGFQFVEENGEVCPAGWEEGGRTIVPDPVGKLKYFGAEE